MRPDAKLPDEIIYKVMEKAPATAAPTAAPKEEEKKPVELSPEKKTDIKLITNISGIGPSVLKKLDKAKVTSLEELYAMNLDDLMAIDGIGKKTAELIVKNIRKLLEEGTRNDSEG